MCGMCECKYLFMRLKNELEIFSFQGNLARQGQGGNCNIISSFD